MAAEEDLPAIPDGYERVPPEDVDEDCLAFDPFTANEQELWSFSIHHEEVPPGLADDNVDGNRRREAWYDVYQHGGYLNRRIPIEGDHKIQFVRPVEDGGEES